MGESTDKHGYGKSVKTSQSQGNVQSQLPSSSYNSCTSHNSSNQLNGDIDVLGVSRAGQRSHENCESKDTSSQVNGTWYGSGGEQVFKKEPHSGSGQESVPKQQ